MQLLAELGQSVWLDSISCSMIESGKLKGMIEKGLRGLTSNPSIFNQAISTTNDYDTKIFQLNEAGQSVFEIYDALTVSDIQGAADLFLPVYEATGKLDGYVSLEINPQLANDSEASIQEGLRLVQKVNRPNLMIKVPATPEGFPVIQELIAQGVSVNSTLIFSLDQYEKTAAAYFAGLSRLAQKTDDLSAVHSVASVFVSRIDSTVDQMIEGLISREKNGIRQKNLASLKGKAAVSNCLNIFRRSQELYASQAFRVLKEKRPNLQRVLWASTSTKNPVYSDIKYVTELIAENTVNTIPEKTLMAFLDHGQVKKGFASDEIHEAARNMATLKTYGIDINAVCDQLLTDGVKAFSKAFEALFASLEEKRKTLSAKL